MMTMKLPAALARAGLLVMLGLWTLNCTSKPPPDVPERVPQPRVTVSFGPPVPLYEGSRGSFHFSWLKSTAGAGVLFFPVPDQGDGSDWWRTDGTEAGTFPLRVGSFADSTLDVGALAVGEYVYLSGPGLGSRTLQLWRSDGSLSGTVPLAPELTGNYAKWFKPFSGGVLLLIEGGSGLELWRGDATGSNLSRVATLDKRVYPDSGWVGMVGSTAYFSLYGSELWKTDGSAAGTVLVRDFGESSRVFVERGTPFNGRIVFTVNGQPWSSDGTSEDTVQLATLVGSDRIDFSPARDGLVFIGCTEAAGCEPWRTDGTPQGTFMLKETSESLTPHLLGAAQGLAYFFGSRSTRPTTLWRTDGTPDGTILLRSDASPSSYKLVEAGGSVFLVGSTLWSSDGTPEGTRELGCCADQILGVREGRLVYSAQGEIRTVSPEGTPAAAGALPAGAVLIGLTPSGRVVFSQGTTGLLFSLPLDTGEQLALPSPLPSAWPDLPSDLTAGADRWLFSRKFGANPGLWQSQGTLESTRLLARLPPPICNTECFPFPMPWAMGAVNGANLFYASDRAVYALRGQDAAPVELLRPASVSTAAEFEGQVLFGATYESVFSLWRSDGTPQGTARVADLPSADWFNGFARSGGRLYFQLGRFNTGTWLWVTDGTAEGTRALRSFAAMEGPQGGGSLPSGRLVFSCSTQDGNGYDSGLEPCVSDGTPEGTRLLADLRPDGGGSKPTAFAAFGGAVYFSADDGVHGRELWRTNGTAVGTKLVADFIRGPGSGSPGLLTASSAGLFFQARTLEHGVELWHLDSAGTLERLTGAMPGLRSGSPTALFPLEPEGVVLFAARTPEHGGELWRSDGTVEGTQRVMDLVPGFSSGNPADFARMGDQIAFTANSAEHGRGVWRMPLIRTEVPAP
jgi:ELWxxDGT repeat protein